MRPYVIAVFSLVLLQSSALAQPADSSRSFLNRRDFVVAGAVLGAAGVLSVFDDDIALASQRGRWQDSSVRRFATRTSKVNETTLTLAGIATYGIARLTKARTVQDIALHATESVVLASFASQLIRGPLGRTRPYVTADSNQYNFRPFRGFFGKNSFDNRAFPSIHTSSSMAVATVLVMETHRRRPNATPFVAPLVFAAGALPGLVRIPLDQHWASDIAMGAFMGVMSGYKVVSYSHAHPNNRFDRMFLSINVAPDADGRMRVGFSPSF